MTEKKLTKANEKKVSELKCVGFDIQNRIDTIVYENQKLNEEVAQLQKQKQELTVEINKIIEDNPKKE